MRKIPDQKTTQEIEWLFILAKEKAKTQEEDARKLIILARNKAKRSNFSIRKYRKLFCRKCNYYFIPGKNCIIRISKGKKNIRCLRCGAYTRIKIK